MSSSKAAAIWKGKELPRTVRWRLPGSGSRWPGKMSMPFCCSRSCTRAATECHRAAIRRASCSVQPREKDQQKPRTNCLPCRAWVVDNLNSGERTRKNSWRAPAGEPALPHAGSEPLRPPGHYIVRALFIFVIGASRLSMPSWRTAWSHGSRSSGVALLLESSGFVPESEFDSVPESELVIDDAKIVFDHVLGSADGVCHLSVFEPEGNEFDDSILSLAGNSCAVAPALEHSCLR